MRESQIFIAFLLVQFSCFPQHIKLVSANLEKYHIYVHNGLPDNSKVFRFHAFSKDTELGYHTLKVGETFDWRFRVQIFQKTNFLGHFWWGNDKERGFSLFDIRLQSKCGENPLEINTCWWHVQKDGFYFSNKVNPKPNELEKMNWWENRTTTF